MSWLDITPDEIAAEKRYDDGADDQWQWDDDEYDRDGDR